MFKEQKYSSANTCRKKISAVITKSIQYIPAGSTVLDYGGGKYDLGTRFLEAKGIKSFIFDPYNKPENNHLISNHYDFGLCGNVLNVVAEKTVRQQIVDDLMSRVPIAFFVVYTGDNSGVGKKTSFGWQNNQPIRFYLDEFYHWGYFPRLNNNKLIIISQ